jgi:hypothetical protein
MRFQCEIELIILLKSVCEEECRNEKHYRKINGTESQLYKMVKEVGLGYETRYIQSTGGYCYSYKGGTSSGQSGPNTWRYDPR